MTKKILFLIIIACLAGCEKNPVKKLINPTESNAINTWDTNGDWVVYDEEIKTGGTIMMFNSMDGQQLDFESRDNPKSGLKCIKYSWNGKDVYKYGTPPGLEHDFCGFSLIASKDTNRYNLDTRDISGGAYTKISFWARGTLNAYVYLRVEGNNGNENTVTPGSDAWMSDTITTGWQKFEFNITPAGNTALKDFIKIILRYDEDITPNTSNTAVGNGGVVFIDDIKLTH